MSEEFADQAVIPFSGGKNFRATLLSGLDAEVEEGFTLPEQLGPFEVIGRIGRGGSGEVWRAFQPGPDREVALKVFLDHRLGGRVDRSLFLHEARVLGKLDHPGIVPVFATGEEGGFLFIASRWMSGGTLEEKIRAGAFKNQPRRAVTIIRDLAKAVAHAHHHGLVHRDIKPANVLLDDQGSPFLADFGIAISEEDGSHGVTSGTPAYMAPEQFQGESVTTATDVWALGYLLREILTGFTPDQGAPGLGRSHSRRIRAIVSCCLEKNPAKRYQEAAGLAEDLDAFLNGRCVSALPEVAPVRVWRWARRRPGQAATTAAAISLGFTALGLTWHSWSVARENERRAEANEQRAAADAARYRERAYVADIYLASRSLADHQLGVTRQTLEHHLPEPGEIDLRGFEWHALHALAEGDAATVFTDHESSVEVVAFSPDSRYLLSGSREGKVIIRDLESGEVTLKVPRDGAPGKAAEIPMMTLLAARSPETRSMLFRGELTPDAFRMRSRPSRIGEVEPVAWAPVGKRFATGCAGSFLRVWSFPEGQLIAVFPQAPTEWIAFSQDGRRLISMTRERHDSKVMVRDLENKKVLWSLDRLEEGVDLHGSRLAVVQRGTREVRILDEESGRVMQQWPVSTSVGDLVWSADGRVLHGASWDGEIRFAWDVSNGSAVQPTRPVLKKIRDLAYGGGHLAMVGEEQVVRLESKNSGVRLLRGHTDEILTVAISRDGKYLASGGKDRTVRLWDDPWEQRTPAPYPNHDQRIRAISPKGDTWLTDSGDLGVELRGESGLIHALSEEQRAAGFDFDGDRFATWRRGTDEIEIKWWSVESGKFLNSYRLSLPKGKCVLGWNGSVGAVAVGKTKVVVFEADHGRVLGDLTGLELEPIRIEVSPAGEDLLLVGWPWHLQQAKLGEGIQPRVRLSKGTIGPVCFSPDGKRFVIGSDQNVIRIFDAASGKEVQKLIGHRAPLLDLAFTPDGRTLASSSKDRTLRLWHVPSWSPLGTVDTERNHHHFRFDLEGSQIRVVPAKAPPFAIPSQRTE
jgi:WD40 repeat protein